jgi:hypothetical protein
MEQEVARVKQDRVLDLFLYRADVCRFPGKTAKLIGFSPTGLGLAEEIVAVDDREIGGRGRVVLAVGHAQEDEEDRQDDYDVRSTAPAHQSSPQIFSLL